MGFILAPNRIANQFCLLIVLAVMFGSMIITGCSYRSDPNYIIVDTQEYTIKEPLRSFEYLAASNQVIIVTDTSLAVRDLDLQKYVLEIDSEIFPVTLSPDETLFAVYAHIGLISIYSSENGQLITQVPTGAYVFSPHRFALGGDNAYSPDGSLLAVGFGGVDIGVWDVRTSELVFTLSADTQTDLRFEEDCGEQMSLHPRWDLDWSEDGKYISSVVCPYVLVWDVQTKKPILVLNIGGWVKHAKLSPDGQYLAVIGVESTLEIIDVDKGKTIKTYELPPARYPCNLRFDGGIAWASVMNHVLINYGSGQWVIVDVHQGIVLEPDNVATSSSTASCSDGAYFSDDGHTIAVSSNNSIEIITLDWD